MSERVSDERLKVMTREGYRLASGSFVDEEISAMARELIERRASDGPDDAVRYESELRRLSEFVQTRHPLGAVKHIGLMETVPAAIELISEASEWIGRQTKDDDNEPITAEWWSEMFQQWSVSLGGIFRLELLPFNAERDWRVYLATADSEHEHKLPHIRTRGDLRRLWVALTGKELES